MFLLGLLRGCLWPAIIGLCFAAFLWFVMGAHPPGGCRSGYSKVVEDSWVQSGYRRKAQRIEIFKCARDE